MSGAMTNLVFRCDLRTPPAGAVNSSVIVRVEGLPSYDPGMELECFKTGAEGRPCSHPLPAIHSS